MNDVSKLTRFEKSFVLYSSKYNLYSKETLVIRELLQDNDPQDFFVSRFYLFGAECSHFLTKKAEDTFFQNVPSAF